MSEAGRLELARVATIVGTAWITFHVVGVMVTWLIGIVASKTLPSGVIWAPPLILGVWFLIAGAGAGFGVAFVARSTLGRVSAALVGVVVGAFALVAYSFTGSAAGREGEQAIRIVCAGLPAALVFALGSRRLNRVAA
jgi:hypothetical protein